MMWYRVNAFPEHIHDHGSERDDALAAEEPGLSYHTMGIE